MKQSLDGSLPKMCPAVRPFDQDGPHSRTQLNIGPVTHICCQPVEEESKCQLKNRIRNQEKNIFVKNQRILMNFHIFFAYNSEISSKLTPKKNLELSKYSELRSETTTLIWKILSDSEIIPSQLGEKFRISFATFGAISELHSEKNSELHL